HFGIYMPQRRTYLRNTVLQGSDIRQDYPTPAPCLSQKLHPLRCEAVFSPAIFSPNNLNGRG
ncbi:MAG: hypothetical protein IK104_00360, partial [Clostridia bacterium]|nr:hypothetical protein [Clostridia bacterium]